VSRLSGIDISENATQALKQRFPEYSFAKRDLAEPGLVQATGAGFELVTAVDMLYHIVNDTHFRAALGNLAAACRPGGFLAIHDFFMHHREMDFGYIKLRTLKDYRAALDKAGFEIVSRTPTFFLTVQTYDYASLATKKRMDKAWSRYIQPFIQRKPDLAGRLGYWSDRILGSILSEGPSFEMMICRRRA
jgi:hypothetical protein